MNDFVFFSSNVCVIEQERPTTKEQHVYVCASDEIDALTLRIRLIQVHETGKKDEGDAGRGALERDRESGYSKQLLKYQLCYVYGMCVSIIMVRYCLLFDRCFLYTLYLVYIFMNDYIISYRFMTR